MKNISQYIEIEISRRLIILEQLGFIISQSDKDTPYLLTQKGDIAANIQEIHCLAIAELIEKGLFTSKDLKQEIEDSLKLKIEIIASKLNLVSREEYEIQKKIIQKLEKELNKLKKQNRKKTTRAKKS